MSATYSNSIIRASAGSGKTYQLVRRYIRLLALGESPESIAAMTFTRKAAHEFFERILQKLAELAGDLSKDQGYVKEIRDQAHAQELLRRVIASMDKMKLGTIDSFFGSIVRCFPYELGLSGSAEVMDESLSQDARAEVMQHLLVELSIKGRSQDLAELLEAWKTANMGHEGNRPANDLSSWFESLHRLYLEAPLSEQWGDVSRIWTQPSDLVYQKLKELPKLLEQMRDAADIEKFDALSVKKWESFFEELETYKPGDLLSNLKSTAYMMDPARTPESDWNEVALGDGGWKMSRRELSLGQAWGSALIDSLRYLLQRELFVRALKTKGKFKIVKQFDQTYHQLVRSAGRLAFADLTWILTGRIRELEDPDVSEWQSLRLNWEYRLDTKFKHWMFDEFQDTSRKQWNIMRNLADEAARDPEGKRTFFAVGDLKQSLYLWRQAEPDLFLEIEEDYREVRMEKSEPLVMSFRSSKEVLDTVNLVFENPDNYQIHYPDAYRWWKFEQHQVAPQNMSKQGYVTLREVAAKGDVSVSDDVVAKMIQEVDPLSRGLSCAILTRSNAEAQRISEALRHRLRVDVVCESEVEISKDNPATLLLLSLLKLSIHPQDTYALEHLLMSPLAAGLVVEFPEHLGANVGSQIRQDVFREGMLHTMTKWVDRLKDALSAQGRTVDEFTQFRLTQWLDLCAQYDADAGADIESFIQSSRGFLWRSSQNLRALQVMTIHKAKGLEFDMVILPHLQNRALDSLSGGGDDFLISRDQSGEVEWLIDKPDKLVLERELRFTQLVKEEKARLAYQGMCRLYVAMTRAKRGLYMLKITGKVKTPQNAESVILENALVLGSDASVNSRKGDDTVKVLYEIGNQSWFEERSIQSSEGTLASERSEEKLAYLKERLRQREFRPMERVSPSNEEDFRLKGSELLSDYRNVTRYYGLLVHEMFSTLEYATEDLDGHFELHKEKLIQSAAGSSWDKALRSIQSCLAEPEIKELFDSNVYQEVWREHRFDLVHDGKWLTGIADRVVIQKDAQGRRIAARVVDFKTDTLPDQAAKQKKIQGYKPQLELYRKAVTKLTLLPESAIGLTLIFTQTGERVDF